MLRAGLGGIYLSLDEVVESDVLCAGGERTVRYSDVCKSRQYVVGKRGENLFSGEVSELYIVTGILLSILI